MINSFQPHGSLSRRGFIGGAAAAAAGVYGFAPAATAAASPRRARPDSTIEGVKVGLIVAPRFLTEGSPAADQILDLLVRLGISWGEIQIAPIEESLGAPPPPPGLGNQAEMTAEQRAERQAARQRGAAALRAWRLGQSMDAFHALRRRFEDAGVAIDVLRFPLEADTPDEEVIYAFQVARALGARGISCEPPLSGTKRLGRLAASYRVLLGYHNHANVTSVEAFGRPGSWEQAFFYSPCNGANFDIGHFTAGNSDPALTVQFVREYHDRITNLHIKDRRIDQGPNVPWGEGDTPLREVLRLMRDEKYPFQATIELEYPIPDGSTPFAEMQRCLEFVRATLSS